jgi:hypothetical protein
MFNTNGTYLYASDWQAKRQSRVARVFVGSHFEQADGDEADQSPSQDTHTITRTVAVS